VSGGVFYWVAAALTGAWSAFMPVDVSWQVSSTHAVLLCGPLRASLNALSPANGLCEVSYAGVSLAGMYFLGVDLTANGRQPLSDFYQRGGDLIARYAQTDERPFAVLAYWRAALLELGGVACPRVDLVVSVETSLLNSRPLVQAQTHLKLAGGGPNFISGKYVLARLATGAVSYAEMCHPDDSIAASIESIGNAMVCTTPLFGQSLEKGVILRSRLRGHFLPAEHDGPLAEAALAEFAASAPPLTT
jgi:hypothetical protein